MFKNPFTVYQHPKTTKSGTYYRWYYYFYDHNGKKVQKACRKCQTREEADRFVSQLPIPNNLKKRSDYVRDIAKDMFLPNSDHLERRKQLGKSTYEGTINESRRFIEIIIQQWGNLELRLIRPEMVMSFLFSVKRSGKWKNKFTQVLNEVYSEAIWYGCKAKPIHTNKFRMNVKKADALTCTEIDRLFKPENFPSYQFYLIFILSLAAGLRMGEARAIRAKQIVFEKSLIIIDGFIQVNFNRTNYNKKGNDENPKFRIVYLNQFVLGLVKDWITQNNLHGDDLLFTKDGKPIRQELLDNTFYKALQKAGIIPKALPRPKNKRGEGRQKQIKAKIKCPDNRKLVPHSLRYTYVSMMLNHVTSADLMPMTGHTSETNVNYYHHKVLDMTVASLPKNLREATDDMIHWENIITPLYHENQQLALFPF